MKLGPGLSLLPPVFIPVRLYNYNYHLSSVYGLITFSFVLLIHCFIINFVRGLSRFFRSEMKPYDVSIIIVVVGIIVN